MTHSKPRLECCGPLKEGRDRVSKMEEAIVVVSGVAPLTFILPPLSEY